MSEGSKFWLGIDPARADDDRTVIVITGICTAAEVLLALENVFVSGTSAPQTIELPALARLTLDNPPPVFSLSTSAREQTQQAWRDIKKKAIDDSKRTQQRMKLSRGRR